MFFNNLPQKLALVLCLASALVYSDTVSIETSNLTSPPIKSETTSRNVFTQFLRKNLQVSLFKYDGSLGLADFFVVGERHHYWGQLGCLDKSLSSVLGIGSGYRYLFKEDEASSDWFLGAYVKAQGSLYAPLQSFKWQLGVEVATHYFQGTLSRYSIFKNNIKDSLDVPEEAVGYSFKLSTSWFERFNAFKNIQPFVILARTKLGDAHEKSFSQPIWNTGIGTRWQLPYITFEIKAVWDALQKAHFLGLQYHFGCQINLIEEKNVRASDVRVRIKKRPESYIPLYYKKDVIRKAKVATIKNIKPNRVVQDNTIEATQLFDDEDSISEISVAPEMIDDFVVVLSGKNLNTVVQSSCERLVSAVQARTSLLEEKLLAKEREDNLLVDGMQESLLGIKVSQNVKELKRVESEMRQRSDELRSQLEIKGLSIGQYINKEEPNLYQLSAKLASLSDLFCSEVEKVIKKSQALIEQEEVQLNELIAQQRECTAFRQEGERLQNKIRRSESDVSMLDTLLAAIGITNIEKSEHSFLREETFSAAQSSNKKIVEKNPQDDYFQVANQIRDYLRVQDKAMFEEVLKQVNTIYEIKNTYQARNQAFEKNKADVESILKGTDDHAFACRRITDIVKKRVDTCIHAKERIDFLHSSSPNDRLCDQLIIAMIERGQKDISITKQEPLLSIERLSSRFREVYLEIADQLIQQFKKEGGWESFLKAIQALQKNLELTFAKLDPSII